MNSRVLVRGIYLGLVGLSLSAIAGFTLYVLGFLGASRDDSAGVGFDDFVSMIVISPLIETSMMAALICAVERFFSWRMLWVAVAILMAALHSLIYLPWGLIIIPQFLIYSKVLSDRERKMSEKFWVVFIAHLTNNALVFSTLVVVYELSS